MSMNNQEFLNKAYEHMRKQEELCRSGITCVYDDGEGRQCAIGGVLSPEARAEAMNGGLWDIAELCIEYAEINYPRVCEELKDVDPDLRSAVQICMHDTLGVGVGDDFRDTHYSLECLNAAADKIAAEFGLVSPSRS